MKKSKSPSEIMAEILDPKSLLQKLRERGVAVQAEVDQGGVARIKLRPVPPAALLDQVRCAREGLLAELAAELRQFDPSIPKCPRCRRPLLKTACWSCNICVCACGRQTESPFLVVCRPCEVAEYRHLGVPF